LDAITAKAQSTGTIVKSSLSDSDLKAAKAAAANASYALVFISADSGEAVPQIIEGNVGGESGLL
jgi:hypothetical protein